MKTLTLLSILALSAPAYAVTIPLARESVKVPVDIEWEVSVTDHVTTLETSGVLENVFLNPNTESLSRGGSMPVSRNILSNTWTIWGGTLFVDSDAAITFDLGGRTSTIEIGGFFSAAVGDELVTELDSGSENGFTWSFETPGQWFVQVDGPISIWKYIPVLQVDALNNPGNLIPQAIYSVRTRTVLPGVIYDQPEPASAVLLGLGLAGVAMMRRKGRDPKAPTPDW